jgi:sortase A
MTRAVAAPWLLTLAVLAGCGGDDGNVRADAATERTVATSGPTPTSATSTSVATTIPVTVAPTTPETTLPPSSTSAPVAETTTVPLTMPDVLPAPIDVPADSRGAEPVIELGSIAIPKIGVEERMFEGIRLTTLDRGPGHWPGTAMPGGIGNVVVAGHRTSHSKPFRKLDQLVPGDQVVFTTGDGVFTYDVTSTEIVEPTATYIVDQTPEKTATLFACHPAGSTKFRIVIHLALVEA